MRYFKTGFVLALALYLVPMAAHAKQLSWNKDDRGYYSVYTFRWEDFDGQPQEIAFKVENSTTQRAQQTDTTFLMSKALDIKYAKAKREAAIRSTGGVSIQPYQAPNGNVGYRYSGDTAKARTLIASIDRRATAAMEQYLSSKNYRLKENGRIESDYQTMARDNFLEIRPLARALQHATKGMNMRDTMNYTLAFLQSIPYETYRPQAGDRGNYIFNSPLTLVSEDKGDCDEKSLAFGTLMRIMYPNLEMGIVLVPGHAFVAMDIPPQKGDMLLPINGKNLVVAEPVGPAYMPVGQISVGSQNLLAQAKAQYRQIPFRF